MDKRTYIQRFHIYGLWGRLNLFWDEINRDVNIIVGSNGSGKTTLLDIVYDYYKGKKIAKEKAARVEGNPTDSQIFYVRSFDIPSTGKKKNESQLLQDLKNIVNQNGSGTSFFDYRMRMLNYADQAVMIKGRIKKFFGIVNTLFSETGKKIVIDGRNNTLAFKLTAPLSSDEFPNKDDDNEDVILDGADISLEQLSSGEKQVLLILTTVFLQEEKECVMLLDEPEISLDISWQDQLVALVRTLNPNCQLIITTHSPNIFANGWEDKLIFIEQLVKSYEC